jgi:hypothetical protein
MTTGTAATKRTGARPVTVTLTIADDNCGSVTVTSYALAATICEGIDRPHGRGSGRASAATEPSFT